jgi:glycine cleavage system H protein
MSLVPAELRYTKEHEWVQELSSTKFRIGITAFAQAALGDIVYIQLPKVGSDVVADKVCGEVESTKSVSEIYAPISGKIVLVNEKLEATPEVINSDPYGAGWIAEIEIATATLENQLLSAQDYQNLTA